MNVVNIAVYKEAKYNKNLRDRIRQEKIRELYTLAERAMDSLEEEAMEELAGAIFDRNNSEINTKVNKLIFKGGIFTAIDEILSDYGVSM